MLLVWVLRSHVGCLTPVRRLAGCLARLGRSLLGVAWCSLARFGAFWSFWAFLGLFCHLLSKEARFARRVSPGISPGVPALRRLPLPGWTRRPGLRWSGVGGFDEPCRRQAVGESLDLLGLAELALLLGDRAAILAAEVPGLVLGLLLALQAHDPTSPMPASARGGQRGRPGYFFIIGPASSRRGNTGRRIAKARRPGPSRPGAARGGTR